MTYSGRNSRLCDVGSSVGKISDLGLDRRKQLLILHIPTRGDREQVYKDHTMCFGFGS